MPPFPRGSEAIVASKSLASKSLHTEAISRPQLDVKNRACRENTGGIHPPRTPKHHGMLSGKVCWELCKSHYLPGLCQGSRYISHSASQYKRQLPTPYRLQELVDPGAQMCLCPLSSLLRPASPSQSDRQALTLSEPSSLTGFPTSRREVCLS